MKLFNRKYKDSVFTDLFGSDKTGKENFLTLYSSLYRQERKAFRTGTEAVRCIL